MNREQLELDIMTALIAKAKNNSRPDIAQWLEQELKQIEYRQFVDFIEGNEEPSLTTLQLF